MEENFYTAAAALNGAGVLDVKAMETIYRLECSGEHFYNMLAERIGNEEAAELLRRNGREELAHARRIAKAISIRLGHEWEPSPEVSTLLPIPMPDEISVEMFRGIVQGEMSGDAGYQAWADQETDPEVEKLLRLNGREETIHAGRVNQVLEILSR